MENLEQALTKILGDGRVLGADRLGLMDPGEDAANLGAGLAVRPANAGHVAEILRLCDRLGVAVVPQGGRTGLAGAAASGPGQLILLTDGLTGPVRIDPLSRIAEVPAGVTLAALQAAAADHGLSPAIDLAARDSATIGGLIATNAGGMEAFRHGTMRHRILGMEAVLADGTVLGDMARVTKANQGYDLKQLFCGAEGTLGVVTRAILRLEDLIEPKHTVLAGLASAADAITLLRGLQATGGVLLAEIMWADYVTAAARTLGLEDLAGQCLAPVCVVLALASDTALEAMADSMETGVVQAAVVAGNARERAKIWRLREDSFAAERGIAHRLWFDVSVPLDDLDGYVARLSDALGRIDGPVHLFVLGHLADGNLHLTVARDRPFETQELHHVAVAVEQGLVAAGGAFSAEHGIGTEKLAAMRRNLSPGTLAAMRAVKQALDPKGIMNPGKVLP